MSEEQDDTTIYKVVVNHEEQYSIWPADRENPLGWRDAGKTGPQAECLAYILAPKRLCRSPTPICALRPTASAAHCNWSAPTAA
jgi:MbtH protein